MIIAIDGYEANIKYRVGVGRFALEIIKAITETNLTFRVYVPNPPISDMPSETDSLKYRVIAPKKLWTFVGLPFALTIDKPKADVIFSPTHYIPRFVSIPRVMTIFDLSYIHYPELFKQKDLHQLIHWTRYSARHATHILTISEFSKSAIMGEYGVSEEHITVVCPGITEFRIQNSMTKFATKYILSVGTLQPRKNYVRLIEAFSRLDGDFDLLIAGKRGWLYEEILAAPKKFGVENRVRFLDFVPDEDLPGLYANALCLALPSLYEGFGLPVLEAMHHGCPIVVSNTSSLPEIAGDAGIYVDPEDVSSIKDGLEKGIKARIEGKKLIAMGLERAKQFTWENAAKKTLAVLEQVYENSH